jgi:hypothetical protein
MSFDWPVALLALLLIPLLVVLYILRERRRTAFAAGFGNPALLPNVVDRAPGRLRRHIPAWRGPMRRSTSSARRQPSCLRSTCHAR